ncbi:helix-turn-helix transcriptional regulator [Streptomyces tubbatahanensis]|uniref:Helix-turn-helix transcriptional regulator n=1 Tax=Streptomyces tubbatahanensis TaxID=2923272 RepID=A0ABY3Y046_9ACTN|nr:helix-turn-helix transcriptional regulator [Streptomyces tubbatahanensis]UNS99954.1 helix-turn-helix transcriptional regulator [Streptomyces tubbatahanensis]
MDRSTGARRGGAAGRTGGSDLGRALRRWRDRADPADAGLPAGGSRRAAGLRREEVASLAGVSVDYVVRLEQGRATSPSEQVLTALGRALRLSDQERRHLFLLAGRAVPDAGRMPSQVSPGVSRLVEQLPATPVGVFDAAWTLLEWNPLFAALLGDPSRLRGRERNVVWRHFTQPPGRVRHSEEQRVRFEAAAVSDLRAATARYPADAGLRSLIAELLGVSRPFARLWDAHAVGAHTRATKTVEHPEVGPLVLDCDVLSSAEGLRVVLYTAARGSQAAERLALLEVLGTQRVWS